MPADLDELTGLPEGHKQQLARDALHALGIDIKRQQGDELIHGCPVADYHRDQERNPTAALNASNLLWHCLGCGAGGTVLWLIATVRGITLTEARAWLTSRAGLTEATTLPDLLNFFDTLYTTKARRPPIPTYSPRMLARWQTIGIPDYITTERGVPNAVAQAKGICTDPEGRVAGRATGPRAVIPHWWNERLVGWQSRRLPDANPRAPKYLSTPGFPREETLYNHDPSHDRDRVIIVESPMSVLRHLHHQPQMEATFGAAISDTQLDLITTNRAEVVFWLDNDTGGWRALEGTSHGGRRRPGAAERAARRCLVTIVENPYDADPADLPDDTVDTLIATSVPWPIWTRPSTLLCHRCTRTTHPGQPCPV